MSEPLATTRREWLALAAAGAIGASAAHARESPAFVTDPGPHVLRFGWPAVKIGSAHYPEGPTGCTVFSFPKRVLAVADLRGGAPVTFFTDRLREHGGWLDALCLAGGSVYGLEAASGVAAAILEARGERTGWDDIALVSGAILYDFGIRKNALYPGRELGRAAFGAAKAGVFALGGRGAGAGASCGKWLFKTTKSELAGQGGAFHQHGPTKIAFFTAVNALGAIVDRKGAVVRGHLDPKSGRRVAMPDLRERAPKEKGNTTLSFLLVSERLSAGALRQLAREVHTSMARAIDPFHTPNDGDVLFAATTNETSNRNLNAFQLAALASECAWDAVLTSFTGR